MFPLEVWEKTPNVYVGGARLDKAYKLYPGIGRHKLQTYVLSFYNAYNKIKKQFS